MNHHRLLMGLLLRNLVTPLFLEGEGTLYVEQEVFLLVMIGFQSPFPMCPKDGHDEI